MRQWIPVLAMLALCSCGEPDSPDFMKICQAQGVMRNYFTASETSCRCVLNKLKEQKFSDKEIGWWAMMLKINQYSAVGKVYDAQNKIANYVARNHILTRCNQ